jgi:hypothetical protein
MYASLLPTVYANNKIRTTAEISVLPAPCQKFNQNWVSCFEEETHEARHFTFYKLTKSHFGYPRFLVRFDIT